MKQTFWIFQTLMSHWRRHPANLATLCIGLAIATALWSGVQALNQQARRSYDQAAAVFGNAGTQTLIPARGAVFSQDLYIKLRLAGWKVSPVLEGMVQIGNSSFRLIGIEPLTLPRASQLARIRDRVGLEEFLKLPWQTIVSPQTLSELNAPDGASLQAETGHALPPLKSITEVPQGLLIVDIGVAQFVLGQQERLSRLIISVNAGYDARSLAAVAGDELRFVEVEEEGDIARLTDSFHLNLTAFGFLAFLVGLFIVHASLGLAFEQRLSMMRTMRAVGISLRGLIAVILLELVSLALVAGTVGMIGGYLIATALLPDVAASLAGLYGAHVAGQLTLEVKWWVSGLGMTALGTLAAAASGLYKTYHLPVLSLAQSYAWREMQERYLWRQAIVALAGFLVSLAALLFGNDLVAGFILISGILLGAALLLPIVLAGILRAGERSATGPLAQWFWADSRQELSGLSLALMALLLALSTNIGVGTMVEGFRKTFMAWLDQRLVAELYFEGASDPDARRIENWLTKRPEVEAILPVWKAETRLLSLPAEVIGFRAHATYREHFPTLSAATDAWDRLHAGSAVLVSEQLAQRMNLGVGATLDIPTSRGMWRTEVVGVYPDYGNPKGQLRIDLDALLLHWPDVRRTSYSLRVTPQLVPGLIDAMRSEFGQAIARIVDQSSLKRLSTGIFERTFAVTTALNTLTLLVSCIALFTSLLTLSNARLAQLAPVWALGVTRRRLSELEFIRILLLAAVTAVFAIPLGLVLAWCLVKVVNVQAFGWRLPLYLFPGQWAKILGLALVTACIASILPIVRLARMAPADLLRIYSNER